MSLKYEKSSLPVEDRTLVEQGLKSLSELQQEIVYLSFDKELSKTEIGKRLSLSHHRLGYEVSQVDALSALVEFYSVE